MMCSAILALNLEHSTSRFYNAHFFHVVVISIMLFLATPHLAADIGILFSYFFVFLFVSSVVISYYTTFLNSELDRILYGILYIKMEKQSREISEIFTSVPKNKRKTSQSPPTAAYSSQSQNRAKWKQKQDEKREKKPLKSELFSLKYESNKIL